MPGAEAPHRFTQIVRSQGRIAGSAALVLVLTLLLALVAARHAAKAVDPNFLKGP